jgi:hypothetical protein
MMKSGAVFLLFFVASCVAGAQQEKLDKFIPPAESHGMGISGYGCDKVYVADSSSTSKHLSYWTLNLWAEYGKERKKNWQKTYHSFEIEAKTNMQASGESARSGAAVGAYGAESYNFTPLNQACAEWGRQLKSALKIDVPLDKEGQKVIHFH